MIFTISWNTPRYSFQNKQSLSIFNDIAYWGINKRIDEHDMNNEQVGESLQLV